MANVAPTEVAELPGIYGPVSVSERMIQRIWAQQELMQREMRTRDGASLLVKHPGRWNQSEEGPDFKEAVLEIGGQSVVGDVEIHFYEKDWERHGHHRDPHFGRVCLHVVLFESSVTSTCDAPVLILGPYLTDDIEGTLLSRHDSGEMAHLFDAWAALGGAEIRKTLMQHAQQRWQQKCAFAQTRIDSLGFDVAMHGLTMEILGYRRNRAAMADAAHTFPIDRWKSDPPAPELVMAQSTKPWKISGMRPANLPVKRLAQYQSLWRMQPKWISQLKELAWPTLSLDAVSAIGSYRRQLGMTALRKEVSAVIGDDISGTRLDTLLIDGWLPLIALDSGIDLSGLWCAWYPGDFPESYIKAIAFHGITDGRANPHANAWNQGLLQSIFTR